MINTKHPHTLMLKTPPTMLRLSGIVKVAGAGRLVRKVREYEYVSKNPEGFTDAQTRA